MEFEITVDGKLRYANNSNYKNDVMIRKEVQLDQAVINEIKRIVTDSEVTAEDDNNWPQPDRVGRQELEIKIGKEHISFTVCDYVPFIRMSAIFFVVTDIIIFMTCPHLVLC